MRAELRTCADPDRRIKLLNLLVRVQGKIANIEARSVADRPQSLEAHLKTMSTAEIVQKRHELEAKLTEHRAKIREANNGAGHASVRDD
ncbi:hypothetical protein JYT15_00330 [Acidimicrobium ferrooxidans]|nr:hypothetical protein [Acidimicrobium ferrooxidans]